MRTSWFRTITTCGVACLLALTACGGDDDVDTVGDQAPADSADGDTPSDAAAPDGQATITIADFAFDGVSEVPVGTTVVVTNTDSAPHTWTALDGTFDSGALSEGDTFEFAFTEPGEYAYQCNFHPSMTGTIVVTG